MNRVMQNSLNRDSWHALRPVFLAIVLVLVMVLAAVDAATITWGCTPSTKDVFGAPLTAPVTYSAVLTSVDGSRLFTQEIQCTNPVSVVVPDPAGLFYTLTTTASNAAGPSYPSNGLRIASVTTGPVPVKIDCVVSAYSDWIAGTWTPEVCTEAGIQTRQDTRTRTVLTPPSGGGVACPVLTEMVTTTQPCAVPALLTVGGDVWQASPNYTNFSWKLGAKVGTIPAKMTCDVNRRIGEDYYRVISAITWTSGKKDYVVAKCRR